MKDYREDRLAIFTPWTRMPAFHLWSIVVHRNQSVLIKVFLFQQSFHGSVDIQHESALAKYSIIYESKRNLAQLLVRTYFWPYRRYRSSKVADFEEVWIGAWIQGSLPELHQYFKDHEISETETSCK